MAMHSQWDELGRLMQAAQRGDADAYLTLLRIITPRIRHAIGRQRGFAGPEAVETGSSTAPGDMVEPPVTKWSSRTLT